MHKLQQYFDFKSAAFGAGGVTLLQTTTPHVTITDVYSAVIAIVTVISQVRLWFKKKPKTDSATQ